MVALGRIECRGMFVARLQQHEHVVLVGALELDRRAQWRGPRRHTVLMSGASTAFIPTTW